MQTLFRPSVSLVTTRRLHPLVYSRSYFSVRHDDGIVTTWLTAGRYNLPGRSITPNDNLLRRRQIVMHKFSSVSTVSEKSEEDAIDRDCIQSDNITAATTIMTTAEVTASTNHDTQTWDETIANLDIADLSAKTLNEDPFVVKPLDLKSHDGLIEQENITATKLYETESSGEVSSTTLSDLLKTDIFAESWREVEKSNTNSSTLSNSGWNDSSAQRRDEHNIKINSIIEHPSRPIEVRYNELLRQTNDILENLVDPDENASSSTLQLTDFDEIMLQWSQFHSEIDRSDGRNDNHVDISGDGNDVFQNDEGSQTITI
eukprot:CCRYP_017139-RA/>CCRYP_017139-RA protein AED:0.46 eAED:0.46 QI:0/-1/0/1/-1/1/1/0/315